MWIFGRGGAKAVGPAKKTSVGWCGWIAVGWKASKFRCSMAEERGRVPEVAGGRRRGTKKNRDGAQPASTGNVKVNMSDPMMLIFPRPEVEAGNLAPLLRRFSPDKLPVGKELAGMMSTFHFAVDGWDDDPHEVYAIAAVRKFYQKLHREWPYAFFFCDLRGESLMMLTMCCLDNLEGQTKAGEALSQVQIDPKELLQFIMQGWGPMNKMCERAGFSERAIYERSKAIMGYYHLPFDVPPPP